MGIWRGPPAYLEAPEVATRLAALPTSDATAAGKGDHAPFENAIGSSGICLDTEDRDKGEFEVIPPIQAGSRERGQQHQTE